MTSSTSLIVARLLMCTSSLPWIKTIALSLFIIFMPPCTSIMTQRDLWLGWVVHTRLRRSPCLFAHVLGYDFVDVSDNRGVKIHDEDAAELYEIIKFCYHPTPKSKKIGFTTNMHTLWYHDQAISPKDLCQGWGCYNWWSLWVRGWAKMPWGVCTTILKWWWRKLTISTRRSKWLQGLWWWWWVFLGCVLAPLSLCPSGVSMPKGEKDEFYLVALNDIWVFVEFSSLVFICIFYGLQTLLYLFVLCVVVWAWWCSSTLTNSMSETMCA